MKKLYDYMLKWADSPYAGVALFIFAAAESVFFPVPVDILFITLALGSLKKTFRYALTCTAGSLIGAFAGYSLGSGLWLTSNGSLTGFAELFMKIPGFSLELFNKLDMAYNKYDFWLIFTAGFIPVPYKIFTISSGIFDVNILEFILASAVSRGARFFLIAFLLRRYGLKIRMIFEKYINYIAVGLTMCIICIVVLIQHFT
jgi:membrane protein YqaA with SNARE-associated domain